MIYPKATTSQTRVYSDGDANGFDCLNFTLSAAAFQFPSQISERVRAISIAGVTIRVKIVAKLKPKTIADAS